MKYCKDTTLNHHLVRKYPSAVELLNNLFSKEGGIHRLFDEEKVLNLDEIEHQRCLKEKISQQSTMDFAMQQEVRVEYSYSDVPDVEPETAEATGTSNLDEDGEIIDGAVEDSSRAASRVQCKLPMDDAFSPPKGFWDWAKFFAWLFTLDWDKMNQVLALPDCSAQETAALYSGNTAAGSYSINWGASYSSATYNEWKEKVIAACMTETNLAAYREANARTGVPVELLAATHYREGSCGSNKSLISGRDIGAAEPDNHNQTYHSLTATAIASAEELLGKNPNLLSDLGSNDPNRAIQALAITTARYNGGGNRNCGRGIDQSNFDPAFQCPAPFNGYDDSYVMNFFDQAHSKMYVIYCSDGKKCTELTPDQRPGVLTMYKMLTEDIIATGIATEAGNLESMTTEI